VDHALNGHLSHQMRDAPNGKMDNDLADSSSLFAGKILVHPQ